MRRETHTTQRWQLVRNSRSGMPGLPNPCFAEEAAKKADIGALRG